MVHGIGHDIEYGVGTSECGVLGLGQRRPRVRV